MTTQNPSPPSIEGTEPADNAQEAIGASEVPALAIDKHDANGVVTWNKVEISSNDGIEYMAFGQVAFFEANGSYTWVVALGGERMLISRNLSRIEKVLPPSLFFRCHRSYLIRVVRRTGSGQGR